MFDVAIKVLQNSKAVVDATEKAKFKSFSHAAASIRKDAIGSIEQADYREASPAGEPPHTHRRMFFWRAIRFAADKHGAVIGTAASVVGEAGAAHEFGGEYKGAVYPERPFMWPALERGAPRFAGEWEGAIGG